MTSYETPTPAYLEDEIDLRDCVKLVAKWKWSILGLILAAALTAFLVSSFYIPPTYESRAVVFLPEGVAGLNWNPAQYKEFALSDLVMTAVTNGITSELELAELKERFSIDLDEKSGLLTAAVRGGTPQEALELAQAWISHFPAAVLEAQRSHIQEQKEEVFTALSQREKKLRQAEEALIAFDQRYDLALESSRLEKLRRELLTMEGRLNELTRSLIPSEMARVAVLDKASSELAGLPPVATGLPSTSQDASEENTDMAIPLHMSLREQLVYVDLKGRLALSKANLEAYHGEVASIEVHLPDVKSEVAKLNESLTSLENKRRQLVEDLEQARELFDKARAHYVTLVEQERQLTTTFNMPCVQQPQVPKEPISPKTKLNMAIAAFLAAFIGVTIPFVVEWWNGEAPSEFSETTTSG